MLPTSVTITEADGGYILKMPAPYASYSNGCTCVCRDWREVVKHVEACFGIKKEASDANA